MLRDAEAIRLEEQTCMMLSKMVERVSTGKSRSLTLCVAFALAIASVASGCGGGPTQNRESDEAGANGEANIKRNVKPEADAEAAVIETEFGTIVIELYPNLAPRAVERFKKLISEGFYNGTTFHRVEDEVIQGGDPNSRDADPSNDGMGGSDYPDLPAEFSDVPFERGIVGAARSRSINSANSQFYITLRRVPRWDEQYTVFGRVIQGMVEANIISTAPVRSGTKNPDPPIFIKRITLQPRASFK